MSDESAFLARLTADPFDSVTRLVYADWLGDRDRWRDASLQRVLADPASDDARLEYAACCEREAERIMQLWPGGITETGEVVFEVEVGGKYVSPRPLRDRAAFIRVQCEIERIRPEADPAKGVNIATGRYTTPPMYDRWKGLDAWEGKLLSLHADAWFPVPDGFGLNWGVYRQPGRTPLPQYYVIQRGFVGLVTCTAADWLQHVDSVLASHPVRKVTLPGFNPVGSSGRVAWMMMPDELFGLPPGERLEFPDHVHPNVVPESFYKDLKGGNLEGHYRVYGAATEAFADLAAVFQLRWAAITFDFRT